MQLLSNGRYHVMVTNAGGGHSRWKDLAITRWREDATRDNWGTFCYLRDVASGEYWSTAHQPVGGRSDRYEAIFSEGRAEFRRRDHGLDVHTEIAVSPEDDVELRRSRIVNRSRMRKVIEITTYAEVVLAPAIADAMHPAFSNLFVETEIARDERAILCTRRARSPADETPCMFHLVTVHGALASDVSYETDRMRFIGRGNTLAAPDAMRERTPLSGTDGSVLDPVVAIRMRVTLEPEAAATIDMVYGVAGSREAALGLVGKYRDPRLADRVVELAWTHAQVVLRQINATESDARLYARLANSIVFANASLRADSAVIARNRRGQSGLWGYAISGDLPIVLLRIADAANLDLVRQIVQAHAYWRLKGLAVDLVIWNEDHAGYRQLLQDQIMGLVAARAEAQLLTRPGGIFVRPGDQISEEDRVLIESVARVILSDAKGTLAEQVGGRARLEARVAKFAPAREARPEPSVDAPSRRELILDNGLGGFTPDGSEYVITTDQDHSTPAPWVNVLANPQFGTVVSESGGGYTWSENAHEFRLTPWSNDPVSDSCGEAYYLRDEETGQVWSATPLPARGRTPYVTRHGFGYTVVRAHRGRHPHRALDARRARCSRQVRNAARLQRVAAAATLSVTGYRGMGAGRPASAIGHARCHGEGRQDRRALRPQSLQHGIRWPRRVLRRRRQQEHADVRPDRIPRAQRHAGCARRAGERKAFRTDRTGARPVWRSSGGARSQARRGARRHVSVGRRKRRRRREGARAAVPRRDSGRRRARRGARAMATDPRRGSRADTGRIARRAVQRLARLPDPRVPRVGAQRASTSPVAHSASATSCRTCSR